MQNSDILFCQQYSLHLLSQNHTSQEQRQLATRFVDQYPLTATAITSPRNWTDKDASRRFESTATRLLQPTLSTVLSKMFSLQRLSYFFAAGLLGTVLVKGVSAMPHEGISGEIARSVDIFPVGEFTDPTTGKAFDLYSDDGTLDALDVFSSYSQGINSTSHLSERNWYDCKRLSNLQTFGCNTGHAIGSFVSATGSAAAGSYLGTLLGEAFNGSRDNQKPRSICLSRDGHNLCVSWATYDTAKLRAGEASNIQQYSIDCGVTGGSAEFKNVMSDGGILFICVSNRADGCGQNVC